MGTKIKTNHAFTKKQLEALNKELKTISKIQVVALRGIEIPSKPQFSDINILKSAYTLDVFLTFIDLSNINYQEFKTYKISSSGAVDYEPKRKMEFKTLQDRVNFFTELYPIEFNY